MSRLPGVRELELAEQVKQYLHVSYEEREHAKRDREVRIFPKGWSHEPDIDCDLAFCAEIFCSGRVEPNAPYFQILAKCDLAHTWSAAV